MVARAVEITVPVVDGSTATLVTRVLAFAAVTLGMLRYTALRAGRRRRDSRDIGILFAGTCLGGLACVPVPLINPAVPTRIVLLACTTALVEEYIFRRRLPEVLEDLVTHEIPSRITWSIPVLAAQVAFATCHFVTVRHTPPFGDGLPILRIFAAGCFLAIIVSSAGLPIAGLIHAALNVLIQTGIAGAFHVPTSRVVLAYSALAIGCVVITGAMRSAIRTAPCVMLRTG